MAFVGQTKPIKKSAPAPAPKKPAAKTSSKKVTTKAAPKAAAPAPAPANTEAQIEDQIRQSYGYAGWAINDPELGPILKQAAKEGWDTERLQGSLEATNWWKTHSDAQRTYQALQATNPAQAQALVAQNLASIKAYAFQMGVNIGPDRLNQIANDMTSQGWNDAQLHQAVASEYHYNPNLGPTAAPDVTAGNIKQVMHDYLVPASDDLLNQWGNWIISGQFTTDDLKQYAGQLAKGIYNDPNFASAIDGGMSSKQYFDPYIQKAAQTLELNPNSIDLESQNYQKLLQQKDPASGQTSIPTLSQFTSTLMSDPTYGYDHTQGARQQAANLVGQLGKQFGVSA